MSAVTSVALRPSEGYQEHSTTYWLQRCRDWSFANKCLLKSADDATNPGSTTNFESAFSNLANSYLRDKAPKLMDYIVGFSLLDKSDDNTRAAAVFGAKIGEMWLYVPVFFLNGELKGHELLYIKNQDLFIPLKDNWLNYLLGRKPLTLGKSVDRNLTQLGVQPPNLSQMTRAPYKLASAPPEPSWTHQMLPWWAHILTTNTATMSKYASLRTPLTFLKEAGSDFFTSFLTDLSQHYPTLIQAFNHYYGPDALTKTANALSAQDRRSTSRSIIKQAAHFGLSCDEPAGKYQPATTDNGGVVSYARDAWDSTKSYLKDHTKKYHDSVEHGSKTLTYKKSSILKKLATKDRKPEDDEPRVDVKVVLREDIWQGGMHDYTLSDSDNQKLIDTGKIVKDNRKDSDISKVYHRTTSFQLYNPDETNIYHVLVKPNKFEKCLVIMGPFGRGGIRPFCTVVSLEGDNRWINLHSSNVFCISRYGKEAWNEWFDKLDDATSLSVSKDRYNGEHTVLITQGGQGTTPITAHEEWDKDSDEGKRYAVDFSDFAELKRPFRFGAARYWNDPYDYENERSHIKTVFLTGKSGTKLRGLSSQLCVPLGTKKLTVRKPQVIDDKEDKYGKGDKADNDKGSKLSISNRESKDDFAKIVRMGGRADDNKNSPFEPGNLEDVQLALYDSLIPLDLLTDGDGNSITVNGRKMKKSSAYKHLITDWSLREDTVDYLLKEAESHFNIPVQTWVKRAGPFMTESQPSAPGFPDQQATPDSFMGSRLPTVSTDQREQVVKDLIPPSGNQELYRPAGPDEDTMHTAQQAAQTGQKEVFDTAMLAGLIKSVRPEHNIDKWVGDIMKGMDRLARTYIQCIWHGEELQNRLGKDDMGELEDGLLNTFEGTGDIVLKLKQRSVEPFAEMGTDVDLGPVANQ